MFIGINSELVGRGVAQHFWMDVSHYLHSIGFRTFYGRFLDVRSAEMMKKMGAIITAREKLNISGKHLDLLFGKVPLMPLLFSWIRFAGS